MTVKCQKNIRDDVKQITGNVKVKPWSEAEARGGALESPHVQEEHDITIESRNSVSGRPGGCF